MPIRYTDDPASPADVQSASEDFIIFYSSRGEDGQMWCPDCRVVESLVNETFAAADGPTALVVWVGQKAAWKTPANAFRGQPWAVGSIPTIIRGKDGARLVEEEITQGLRPFVEGA